MSQSPATTPKTGWRSLPRNVWAVSLTSFFMDISSEMVLNILPLYLSNVVGVGTVIIGIIEGITDATASLLQIFSGWLSDKWQSRKWLAVAGYGLSAVTKPFFLFAAVWQVALAVRWFDRVGKGIRTAPRDALVADSINAEQRGLAFGFHRAADTSGAFIGLVIALLVVWLAQANAVNLNEHTFQLIVLASLAPAFLAVLALVIGAKEVPITSQRTRPQITFKGLGKPFLVFIGIVSLFTLGNSSDAFIVLRAQERGLNVLAILGMLITFNLVYTLVSTPAGSLSDRLGRRVIIIGGWLLYALVYFGLAIAQTGAHVWLFYAIYGLYYGLAYGTTKALVADIVPAELRGTAYGTYNAVLGLLAFPASLIAGLLWQGAGSWAGFGPSAPFYFGAAMALGAAVLMMLWKPSPR